MFTQIKIPRNRQRVVRGLWRSIHLAAAAIVGWLVSCQWIFSQEIVRFDRMEPRSTESINCWDLEATAAMSFWVQPATQFQTPPNLPQPTTIHKPTFRYGDFGATSYPIRSRATGYYQSRVDWTWQ